MSVRIPPDLSTALRLESGDSVLRHELLRESAANFGKLGRQIERSLARLDTLGPDADAAARTAALYACAEAVWRFFVQREMCGLVNHDAVIECYGIPPEVLARVGARPPEDELPRERSA